MKKLLWFIFAAFFSMPTSASCFDIAAIEPSRGAPGSLIAIAGDNFPKEISLTLGEVIVEPRMIFTNHIEFMVPNLTAGSYVLTVENLNTREKMTYRFEVMAPTPVISTIAPRTLDACNLDGEYQVSIYGRNFLPQATLLLDGKVVSSEVLNSNHLEAELPNKLSPGIYGVVVRNPDGASSLPHSVTVNSAPEIYYVERGADFVNSYEIIIHGKNFQFNSILVVNEPENSSFGQTFQQLSIFARTGSEGNSNISEVSYKDCQTLIYRRYPTSFQNKELGLQVFNRDGENTDLFFVNLP